MSALVVLLLALLPAETDPLAPLGAAPVRAERVVKRGETVTLRVRQGPLTISTQARALNDAAAGERVRLMVTATRRTLDAIAEAPGSALLIER